MSETEKTITCCNCHNEIMFDAVIEHDGEPYCEDCHNELFVMCDRCDDVVDNGDITEFGNGYYCEDCIDYVSFTCCDCGNRYPTDEQHISDSGNSYCSDCYNERFTCCYGCECEIGIDDAYSDGSDYYCEDCYPSQSRDGVYNYSYKPDPEFHGTSDNGLYFGVELEVERESGDISDVVSDMPEFVYCKDDGSLDDGFEIVSHPFSWGWLSENKDVWENILQIRDNGFRSYDTTTCGMHIHLSARAFSTLHLYRFIKLFYENGEMILTVSQRKSDKLQMWAAIEERSDSYSLAYKAKYKTCKEKYSAINLLNDDTIEIRIFRGTLNPKSFFKNIEFTYAAYEYTRTTQLASEITEKGFIEYVKGNAEIYPNLLSFMREKRLCALPYTSQRK